MDCWKGQSVAGGQQMLTGTDNRLVTGGLDGRIVVWNQHQVVYNNYYPAHPTGKLVTFNFMYLSTRWLPEIKRFIKKQMQLT